MSLLDLRSDVKLVGDEPAAPVIRSRGRSNAQRPTPERLFGYEVLSRLGEGAGSSVYEVRDPASQRRFALKHVLVAEPKHLRFIEQLEREHEVGQAVRHEGLRQPLAIQFRRTLLRRVTEAALVMELVEGWPISTPTRPVAQSLSYLVQVSRTLEAFHKAGYVHCDLKPQNLLVDGKLRVKLIDLGQACRIGTVKGRVQGSPDFISPEQVKCREVTPRTDVYNLGATAYCILTGQKIPTLFTLKKGENSFLVDGHIAPPAEIAREVPPLLSALVMHCISLKTEQRPEMAEVTRRLEAIRYRQRAEAPGRTSRTRKHD